MAAITLFLSLTLLSLVSAFTVQPTSTGALRTARVHVHSMAGFGGAASKSGKSKKGGGKGAGKAKSPGKAPLSPKRQWDIFRDQIDAPKVSVFARLPDEDARWFWCGEVNAAPPATAEQSAAVHKRLILEHAVRCNPVLTARAKELQLGVAPDEDAEPALLPKQEDLPPPQAVGFSGKPDTASGYYVTYGAASEAFTGSSKKLGMGGF